MASAENDGRSGATAGAWAAAAMVLALGALGFAAVAHFRINELERRLIRVEHDEVGASPTSAPTGGAGALGSTTSTTSLDDPTGSASGTTTITVASGSPVDPDAARAAIGRAFGVVYDGALGVDTRAGAVDDPSGLAVGLQTLFSGPYAAGAASSRGEVSAVTFTSPTRAQVSYSVNVDGAAPLPGRTGEARVVGGDWKVTRATVCGDLAVLGAPCGG